MAAWRLGFKVGIWGEVGRTSGNQGQDVMDSDIKTHRVKIAFPSEAQGKQSTCVFAPPHFPPYPDQ